MKIEMPLTLDVAGDKPFAPYITAKCGDHKSRIVKIVLVNNGKPVGAPNGVIALLNCLKPDGTYVEIVGTVSEGTLEFELSAQALSVPGDVNCEVQLIDAVEDALLTSNNMVIRVLPGVIPEEAIESSSEYPLLLELINSYATIDDQMSDTSENAVQNKIVKKYVDDKISLMPETYTKAEVDLAIDAAINAAIGMALEGDY